MTSVACCEDYSARGCGPASVFAADYFQSQSHLDYQHEDAADPAQQFSLSLSLVQSAKIVKEPKGFVSGFNFFAQRVRSTMSHQFKNLSNNEINKVVGQLWRKLPSSEKTAFLDKGEEDKLRYLQEVHIFNTFHGGNIVPKIDPPIGYGLDGKPLPSMLQSIEKSDHIKQSRRSRSFDLHDQDQTTAMFQVQKKRGRRKKAAVDCDAEAALVATRLARKRTAYSVFAHEERIFLDGLKFDNMQKGLGRYLSHRWKMMDNREKQTYEAIAAESGPRIRQA